MYLYDFDDTIYNGDSTIDMLKYSLLRHPFLVIISVLKTIKVYNKYKKKEVPFENVKESIFSFLPKIKNLDKYVDKFVGKKLHKMKSWYLNNKKNEDIVISASFDLWINKFCKKVGIKYVIATKYDVETGKIIGKNCKKEEKLIRLNEYIPNAIALEAYSDSKSDEPMLKLAKKAFIVEGNKLIPYTEDYKFKVSR